MAERNDRGAELNETLVVHPRGIKEYWRDIPGYVGYYRISDLGRGKSVARFSKVKNRWYGGELQNIGCFPGNYPVANLWVHNKGRMVKTAILVLLAFVGPCPERMESCHGDGNKTNSRLDNLRWDTRSANQMDRVEHGSSNRGERQGLAVLTEAKVREARQLRKEDPRKWSYGKLRQRYGCGFITIYKAVIGATWGWLDATG